MTDEPYNKTNLDLDVIGNCNGRRAVVVGLINSAMRLIKTWEEAY